MQVMSQSQRRTRVVCSRPFCASKTANTTPGERFLDIDENMPGCAIFECKNRTGNKNNVLKGVAVKFFRLPAVRLREGEESRVLSEERRRLWKAAINRKDITTEETWSRTFVCSRHFAGGVSAHPFQKNNPSWLPTLHLGYKSFNPVCDTERLADRYYRLKHRRERPKTKEISTKRPSLDIATENLQNDVHLPGPPDEHLQVDIHFSGPPTQNLQDQYLPGLPDEHPQVDEHLPGPPQNLQDQLHAPGLPRSQDINRQMPVAGVSVCDACVLTDLTAEDIDRVNEDNRARVLESVQFRTKLSLYDMRYYEGNDPKVDYYTGISTFGVLRIVFQFVEDHMSNLTTGLSKEQAFLMCLVKLRLNYQFQDMAYQLGVHCTTVQRNFHKTLDVLVARLSFLIKWPEREDLQISMPMCFRQSFGNKVSVIVDCVELFSEKPPGAANQVLTYSKYKHHQTVKYLIGITPQGVVSFLTEASGGKTSDKHIIEESGLLNNLLPGDILMADRGFDTADQVTFYQAKLVIPNFTHGRKQLHPLAVENTQKVASVRGHVKRVIGRISRLFTILQSTVPIEFMRLKKGASDPTVDKIVKVCCCLTNLQHSVVPLE